LLFTEKSLSILQVPVVYFLTKKFVNFVINYLIVTVGVLLIKLYNSRKYSVEWTKTGKFLGIWLGNN